MSLIKTGLLNVTVAQFKFRIKAYSALFMTMAAVQTIAVLLSLGGLGSWSSGVGAAVFSIRTISNEIIVALTFFWAFIVSIVLTTKGYRDADSVFVSNRLSSNLANGAFLLACSLAGGLSGVLGGMVLRLAVFITTGGAGIISRNFMPTIAELTAGFAVNALYLLLFCAIGYLCGILVQYSKVFMFILPSLFFGILILAGRDAAIREILMPIINFVALESSLIMLALKVTFISGAIFGVAFLISNRSEVRQ